MSDSITFTDRKAGVAVKVSSGNAGLLGQVREAVKEYGQDEEIEAIIQETADGLHCTGFIHSRDLELLQHTELFEDEHFEHMDFKTLMGLLENGDR